jgi:hypothetical protein
MLISREIPRTISKPIIEANHYLRSFPSGWTFSYQHGEAIVVYSIPANKNLGPYLFGPDIEVRELARLWAPDHHEPNLLTAAIAASVKALRRQHPKVHALVSFADVNQEHHGGIYQAASWIFTGQSSESRVYITPDGRTMSRRSFHSGGTSHIPGIKPIKLPGKYRYVRPLTRQARKALRHPALDYPKDTEQCPKPKTTNVVPMTVDAGTTAEQGVFELFAAAR